MKVKYVLEGDKLDKNHTVTRKNLSLERKITSKDLPILILLLTKSMAEENEN